VFGYSQSATISSEEMAALAGTTLSQPVTFVLVGDPNAPNGGLFERFAGLDLASLGITFSGATPSDDFPTTIYTIEYDGLADSPEYPIDLPADLNAFLGVYYLHGTYPELTQQQVATAFLLPGSQALGTPGSMTNYYLIPTANLPLLDPLRSIPLVGTPLADLLQPDLAVIVNLGYGPDNVGYSTPANVPTTFGLFPDVNPLTVLSELGTGAEQGISQFVTDLSSPGALSLGSLSSTSSLTSLVSTLESAASNPASLINGLSSAASTLYGTLLPTADIVNALLTSAPAYLAGVSLSSLEGGNYLDAVGLPVAGETGLLTLAGGFEFEVLADAVSTAVSDITDPPADPPATPAVTPAVTASPLAKVTTATTTTTTTTPPTAKTLTAGTKSSAGPLSSAFAKIQAALTKGTKTPPKHAK
jgi:hypothetical protein